MRGKSSGTASASAVRQSDSRAARCTHSYDKCSATGGSPGVILFPHAQVSVSYVSFPLPEMGRDTAEPSRGFTKRT